MLARMHADLFHANKTKAFARSPLNCAPVAKCAGSARLINNRTRRFTHVNTSGPPVNYEIENFKFGATKN